MKRKKVMRGRSEMKVEVDGFEMFVSIGAVRRGGVKALFCDEWIFFLVVRGLWMGKSFGGDTTVRLGKLEHAERAMLCNTRISRKRIFSMFVSLLNHREKGGNIQRGRGEGNKMTRIGGFFGGGFACIGLNTSSLV